MFIAAALQKPSEGFRIKSVFSKKIICESIALEENGLSFVLLKLKSPELINSLKAISFIGKKRVILSREISETCVKPYNFTSNYEYEQLLFRNGIALLLEGLRHNALNSGGKNSSAVLIDTQGRHQDIADILLKSFKKLKIVTAKTELYKNYAASKLYECGAAVILQSRLADCENTDLFVSPDGVLFGEMLKSEALIISRASGDKPPFSKAPIISSFRASVPKEYEELISMNFDGHQLLAALYRYCGIRSRQILLPTHAAVNGDYKSLNEINCFFY